MCCQADLRDLVRTMPEMCKAGLNVFGIFHELSADANARIVPPPDGVKRHPCWPIDIVHFPKGDALVACAARAFER
jgi:hypothetical protein